MFKSLALLTFVIALCAVTATAQGHPAKAKDHPAKAEAAPTVADQIAFLQNMCSESATARTERHAEKSLYERLGGYDKIHALCKDIVRRHEANEPIKRVMVGVDGDKLAKHVADFIAAGTGGQEKYTGRDMPGSHAHLKLTDGDFLAAGSDVMNAMKDMKYGQNEIDEIICILVSLKDQVVFK